MRKLKNTLLLITLLFGMTMYSSNDPINDDNVTIEEQISELLKGPDIPFENTMKISVVFTYTEDNKISIKRIGCLDSEIWAYVHERLNNKVIKSESLKPTQVYNLPLTLIPVL